MGDSYVELMWRVIKDRELKAAFDDLADAQQYAKLISGEVIVMTHKKVVDVS